MIQIQAKLSFCCVFCDLDFFLWLYIFLTRRIKEMKKEVYFLKEELDKKE